MDKWKRKGSNDTVGNLPGIVAPSPSTDNSVTQSVSPSLSLNDKWNRKNTSTAGTNEVESASSSAPSLASTKNSTTTNGTVPSEDDNLSTLTNISNFLDTTFGNDLSTPMKYGILFGFGGFSILLGSFKLRSGLEKWITEDDNNKLNKSNTSSKTKQFLAQGISKHNISSSSASVPKLTFSPTNLALKAFLYGGVIASTVVGSIGLFTYKVILPYTIERDRKRYQQEYYDNQAKELVSEFTSAVSEDKLR